MILTQFSIITISSNYVKQLLWNVYFLSLYLSHSYVSLSLFNLFFIWIPY